MSLEKHVNKFTLGLAGLALAANLSCGVKANSDANESSQSYQSSERLTPEDLKKYTDILGLPAPSQEDIDKMYADPEFSRRLEEAGERGAEYGSILNKIYNAKVLEISYGKPFDPRDVLKFYLSESSPQDSERVFDAYREDFKYLNPGLKPGMTVDYLKVRDLNGDNK